MPNIPSISATLEPVGLKFLRLLVFCLKAMRLPGCLYLSLIVPKLYRFVLEHCQFPFNTLFFNATGNDTA